MTQSSSLNRAPGANVRILSRPALPVAALALGMLLCSAAAQADSYSTSGAAFTPSYIALNLGTADLSRPITAFGVFGGQQQGQAHGLAIGNYFSGTNYGIEASYADLGSVTRYGGDTKVAPGQSVAVLGIDGDLPCHAAFIVAWLKAGHAPGAGGFEGLEQHCRLARRDRDRVVHVLVMALGRLAHLLGVLGQLFFLAYHQLMARFA